MAVNVFFLALMPLSHAISWWAVLTHRGDASGFYTAVASVAAFYCAWALYKVIVQGDKNEKGQFSMGLLTVTATLGQGYPYMIAACVALVIFNFAIVIPFFVNRGVAGIVNLVHKDVNSLTMTWGYVFLGYLLGNIVLWVFTLKTILGFAQP
jgi:hypothetical protein